MVTAAAPQGEVAFSPRGAAAAMFGHHESELVIAGAAGTGKTFAALWRLHLCAMKYPGMRGLMVRKTLESLTASALVTYQHRILGTARWGVKSFGGSKLNPAGFHYPNGSTLLVGGLDKAEKVMSQEYDLIYVNESTDLDEASWEALTTRARYGVMPYQQVFGDCNPGPPGHWLYRRVHVAKKTTLLTSVHKDNPSLWDGQDWTPQGRAYLATLANLTGHRRARLFEGLWTAAEGAVYPEFSRATHVETVDCEGWATVLGLDVGTRNPTALLTVRFAGDRIHVEREDHRTGLGSDDITDAVADEFVRSGALYVVVDPSAAGIIVSLANRGVACRPANNDVQEGIRRVTSALSSLTIDPSCIKTIEEMEGYHYPPGRVERDAPVKADDHSADVIRYVTMDLTQPPTAFAIW